MKILFACTELSFPYIFHACKDLTEKNIKVELYYAKENFNLKNKKLIKDNKGFKLKINYFSKKKSKRIDIKYLKYLEKNILINHSIWKIVSSDRQFGRGYIKHVEGYNSIYKKKKEKILIDIIDHAKYIENILVKLKPNFFFWPTCVSSIHGLLFSSFCKYYNIRFLTAVTTRFQNYFYFANDLYYSKPEILINYNNKKNLKQNQKKVNKIYRNIILKNNLSSDSKLVERNLRIINSSTLIKFLSFSLFVLKHIAMWMLTKLNFNISGYVDYENYPLFSPIREKYQKLCCSYFLSRIKYNNNLNENFIYLPLHKNPEFSTQIKGNKYMDQLFLIETLSKNLPIGYKLFVKEHPSMIDAHGRSIEFYKTILNFPNVNLVDIKIPGSELIKKASLVVIIDSTSAVEAILKRKPVLTMVPFVYDFLKLSITNNNISNLNYDILEALKIKSKYSKKEIEKKIKKLINSLLNCSYWMSNTDTFYYTSSKINLSDFKSVAKDYSNAIIKELSSK